MTTKDTIKNMFLSGHVLTSCGTAQSFISADLRKYVTLLRREGLNITDQWVTSDRGKRFKKYFIPTNKQLTLL